MQLTPEQLDRAARKLCELWKQMAPSPHYVAGHPVVTMRLIKFTSDYPDMLEAIIDAVTNEKDKRIAFLEASLKAKTVHWEAMSRMAEVPAMVSAGDTEFQQVSADVLSQYGGALKRMADGKHVDTKDEATQ